MISRRRFLQAGAAAGVVVAMPRWAYPFSQSVTPIKKFAVDLPLLVAEGSTSPGIPVLTPDTTAIPGTDVYNIVTGEFTQDLLGKASSFGHMQKLWGYAGAATRDWRYLGGVIVATGGKVNPRPVRLRVTNSLPAKQILPVDDTLIDPLVAGDPGIKRQDRIVLHLHGGFTFWQFDGGPFSWFSSANPSNGGFVGGTSFQNPGPSIGTAVYDYPNSQSARTLWYHDHAYGLTRTNVYAGLASLYIITDNDPDGEAGLISRGVIPGLLFNDALTGRLGFPLILQDKTFWDGPSGHDPGYASVPPSGGIVEGDLWYPHIYEGDLDANLPSMVLPPNPADSGNHSRWGTTLPGAAPPISSVPEFFSDTILVNGAPYPTINVDPKRYRFRFLNASVSRFYNLQLYVGDSSKDGITLMPIGAATVPDNCDNNGNVLLVPQNASGPAFIQIANEAGFLPAPALFSTSPTTNTNSNKVIKYKNATDVRKHHRRADGLLSYVGDPTIGNVSQQNLLMAPAERSDVIIDFRDFQNQDLILYSDAPGPFPGGDIRNDYFVFNPTNFGLPANYHDLISIGGAPPTVSGEGPDTRVLMRFHVNNIANSTEPSFADTVAMLQSTSSGLPFVFANTQPPTDISGKAFVKTLAEDNDEYGRLRQLLGVLPPPAVQTYLDFPTEIAVKGEVQEWQIYNLTADTHPMHFHLVNVHVLRRERWAFNPDGTPQIPLSIIPNSAVPPDPNEEGWKETVRMNPGEVTTVVMKFELPPGGPPPDSKRLLATYGIKGSEYVWHCHILEHEEHDMMHAIVVI